MTTSVEFEIAALKEQNLRLAADLDKAREEIKRATYGDVAVPLAERVKAAEAAGDWAHAMELKTERLRQMTPGYRTLEQAEQDAAASAADNPDEAPVPTADLRAQIAAAEAAKDWNLSSILKAKALLQARDGRDLPLVMAGPGSDGSAGGGLTWPRPRSGRWATRRRCVSGCWRSRMAGRERVGTAGWCAR